LHIQFGALKRMLSDQAFTQEGRRYVHGSQSAKCNFAYLEKPKIEADSGRLRIRARFTGRSALNMFGQCVGVGDAFDVVVTARPDYKDGNLRLQDVKVVSDNKSGFYIRRVCSAMEASLARDFRYPLEHAASAILEDATAQPAYKRELKAFRVPEVRVSSDALILVLDFQLTVK
jgi:hypothetical protein